MAIKKYLRRKKRTKGEMKSVPFFQSESPVHEEGHGGNFFTSAEIPVQTKLKVSKPGDPQELEADKMADRVIHKKEMEEKDKNKVSKQDKEDPDKLHKKADEEEKVSKKATDNKLDAKEEDESHDRDQLEDHSIATKMNTTAGGKAKSAGITAGSDSSTSLQPDTAKEMSSSFGYDFSKVKIFNGPEAAEATERLGAQAFTYKGDIYFNENNFDPSTEKGKWLLAHELTHVVQQRGDALMPVMKKEVPGISMPVPEKFVVKKQEQTIIAAEGKVMGTKVRILPDDSGNVKEGKDAATSLNLQYHIDAPIITAGKITRSGGKAVITLVIRTTYREGVDSTGPSKFGRGTTADDKKAGNVTLRFHEGTHGERALVYLAQHPLPTFEGKTGDTVKVYEAAVTTFEKKLEDYKNKMLKDNFEAGDCSGTPDPACPK